MAASAAVASAACVGVAVRVAASGPSAPELASAATTVILAAAIPLAARAGAADRSMSAGLATAARIAILAWCAAATAGLTAGGVAGGPLGAGLVVAAVAVLAFGLTSVLRRVGMPDAHSMFVGAGLACVPMALIFVADPWIEWERSSPSAPSRAALVLAANPLAAMTSSSGGLGVDFQRMPWLYDGPDAGVPGLSLVGQYYPSVPPAAVPWSLAVLAAAGVLVAISSRKR